MTPAMTRAEREEASAFGHADVPPDATAAYGPHPDQVVDFFLPRGGPAPHGPPTASVIAPTAAPHIGTDHTDRAPAPRVPPVVPPVASRAVPLVVLFHGGAWRALHDRRHLSPLAAYLAGHGLAVASVEYRRGPAAAARPPLSAQPLSAQPGSAQPGSAHEAGRSRAGRWPATFDDIAAALDALPTLVRSLATGPSRGPHAAAQWASIDADRPILVGHSAGGHAALWAAARHRLPVGSRWRLPAPPTLRGVVALAPVADFTTARALDVCSDAVTELLTSHASDEPAAPTAAPMTATSDAAATLLAHRLSCTDPAVLLPTGIATTVVQGSADIDVPRAVAEAFVTAAGAVGQSVRLITMEGVGHFPLIDPATPATHTVLAEITRLG
ncbi:alpha/beta hydrolase [Streptomyces zagrosensis]|uniref:Acetyl esterase/lipase n=1 Tax=Streptomyces zagrosensis TaxID=1042984 RepID=A0A7W9UWR6_9ACTN|nr:alpha/beta hydrolase [Streptomyces zagrosensis]MBB5933827.1 acetyl esterase/lipase [Streptomyces zagrosensis]